MESQPDKTASKAPPKVTFERALERVRSQIEIRNDIMRASLETALRLQEGRGGAQGEGEDDMHAGRG